MKYINISIVKKIITLCFIIAFLLNAMLYAENSTAKEKTVTDVIMEEITDNTDNPFFTIPIKISNFVFNFKITKHLILVTLAAILCVISMKYLAHKLKRPFKKPSYIQSILEIIVDYMSKDVLEPTLGENGKRYLPFCLTIFMYVLFCNFIGLIPPLLQFKGENGHYVYLAGTVGGNLGFTCAMAIVVFIAYNIAGMRKKGVLKYWLTLAPKGLPLPLIPLLWLLELITLFNRAFALAIRLFANMTGGHIMLIVIPYLIIMSKTLLVSPFAVLFLGFIYVLEILVAVLQAYVFALLLAVYIGLSTGDEH